MKRIIYLLLATVLVAACWSNTNSNKNQTTRPQVTYIYDGDKEICLYSGAPNRWKPATVDGQSAEWYESEKEFYSTDGISLRTITRKYIGIDRSDVFGTPDIVIWPEIGMVFLGLDNINAGFDNPFNERKGKRCYKKR